MTHCEPNFDEPRPAARSTRAMQVMTLFGLQPVPAFSVGRGEICSRRLRRLIPGPGQIVHISGPSGSGKSRLLKRVRQAASARWIDLHALALPDCPAIDCVGDNLHDSLRLLSLAGLCEAWCYLRTPSELSDGQRWRLRLAMGLRLALRHDAPAILACDEFAAVLDRITAQVVAHAVSRLIRKNKLSLIVATSHDDLRSALKPDLHVRCDFERVRITPGNRKHQAHPPKTRFVDPVIAERPTPQTG